MDEHNGNGRAQRVMAISAKAGRRGTGYARRRRHLRVERLEGRDLPASFLVSTTADSGPGSLRQAILDANASLVSAPDRNVIAFQIGTGPGTISPLSPLPEIRKPLLLDGRTQPGFGGTPIVTLDGSAAFNAQGTRAGVDGLRISAGSSLVRGLVIDAFGGAGIHLLTGGSNRIEGNDIGTDLTGAGGRGNVGDGILVQDSPGNTIGGFSTDTGNVISDNGKNSTSVSTSTSPSTGLSPDRIAQADFNGDGRPDLVTANFSTRDLSVLINDGRGGFRPSVSLPTNSSRVVTGDFNGDGKADIATVSVRTDPASQNLVSIVRVFLGNGDGTFRGPVDSLLGPGRVGVDDLVAGDFNRDGKMDLATANRDTDGAITSTTRGTIAVLISLGDGSFRSPVTIDTGFTACSGLVVADLDRDGKPDLAVAGTTFDPGRQVLDDGVRVLRGLGDGTFQFVGPITVLGHNLSRGIAAADFNHDGSIDLATSATVLSLPAATAGGAINPLTSAVAGGVVSVLLGNGDATFGSPTDIAVGDDPRRLSTADVTGDGRLDIITANRGRPTGLDGDVSVLPGNGDGTFATEIRLRAGIGPDDVTTGDFVGDGRTEFAVADPIANEVVVVQSVTPGHGIHIRGASSIGNQLLSNVIGTDASGKVALGNHGDGVRIEGASGNQVGAATLGSANLISGNDRNGVTVLGLLGTGLDATGNVVEGNAIGIDSSTTLPIANRGDGVAFLNAANGTIGGTGVGSANVISGNGADGVRLSGPGASGNLVFDNVIGTNFIGVANLSNNGAGVEIDDAPRNVVGGDRFSTDVDAKFANDISSNRGRGVLISGAQADGNRVVGNRIRNNLDNGVAILDASDNTIGSSIATTPNGARQTIGSNGAPSRTAVPGAPVPSGILISGPGAQRNVVVGDIVADNAGDGILVRGGSSNTIGGIIAGAGNSIRTNGLAGIRITTGLALPSLLSGGNANFVGGNAILRNGSDGIAVVGDVITVRARGVDSNIIGATADAARNTLSGNAGDGIRIANASRTVVRHTLIGLNRASLLDPTRPPAEGTGNALSGISLAEASGSTIGGPSASDRNLIAGNGQDGIHVSGGKATNNLILNNFIGTDATGTLVFEPGGSIRYGNGGDGVRIDGASFNTLGSPGAGNIIAGNRGDGIALGDGASSNRLEGNAIGALFSGNSGPFLGNAGDGVSITNGRSNSVGGRAVGAGNLISGNAVAGVAISGPGATGNTVVGNLVGTDATGTTILSNARGGVLLTLGASGNSVGGTSQGSRNVISGNPIGGVILSQAADANVVQGNVLGLDASGARRLGNTFGVLILNSSGNLIGGPGGGNVISGNDLAGIDISGNDPASPTAGNVIQGNRIGTDPNGATGVSASGDRFGNVTDGIAIDASAGNVVGGASDPLRNVISGNLGNGLHISNAASRANTVLGNRIGTDSGGANPIGNAIDGVFVENAPDNAIGAGTAGAGNLISSNGTDGIQLLGAATTGTLVQGNRIGTDATGERGLGNARDGIFLNAAPRNTLGGDAATEGNLISGNRADGVEIVGTDAAGNLIAGNTIGTNSVGLAPLGNGHSGVVIVGATRTLVGGSTPARGNLISGNGEDGVHIANLVADPTKAGVPSAMIQGNFLGTDAPGRHALANGAVGVLVENSAGVLVGGVQAGQGNVISGNLVAGVQIAGGVSRGNQVWGNFLGVDASGIAALGNGIGVFLDGAPANTVGGAEPGAGNVISGNSLVGVQVSGDGAVANRIRGNRIGTNRTGASALGNGIGVLVNDVSGNTIGGTDPGGGNLISGNVSAGVEILGRNATANVVAGNRIGTDQAGLRPLSRSGSTDLQRLQNVGVLINDSIGNLVGGTDGRARNVISGNVVGVEIAGFDEDLQFDPGTRSNLVQGNYIGVDATGLAPLGNTTGVFVNGASGNILGGSQAGARNVISANTQFGVLLFGNLTTRNLVLGNYVGPGSDGRAAFRTADRRGFLQPIGVGVQDASNNTIGLRGAGNVLSGNDQAAVYILGQSGTARGNVVQANLIGPGADGRRGPGNRQYGVLLFNAAKNPVPRRGPAANSFAGNGIASFREFTGPKTDAASASSARPHRVRAKGGHVPTPSSFACRPAGVAV